MEEMQAGEGKEGNKRERKKSGRTRPRPRFPLFKPFSPIQFTAYPQVIHKKELHYVKF